MIASEEQINQIKNRLEEYVESILHHSVKGNRHAYICPLCDSGTGANQTGAFTINKHDPTQWKCFACNESGDIFDLIGHLEQIPDFKGRLIKAGEIFDMDLHVNNDNYTEFSKDADFNFNFMQEEQTPQPKEPQPVQQTADFLAYYEEAHRNISKSTYLVQRGLTDKTINRFKIGYDANFKHPNLTKNIKGYPAIVIPTSPKDYTVRFTNNNVNPKTMKIGKSILFNFITLQRNPDKPIFIVEGEIDALSIMEVGGEAVALGGATNVNNFLQALASSINSDSPLNLDRPLILALDKDIKGEQAKEELAKGLDAIQQKYTIAELWDNVKDCNDMLVENKIGFMNWVVKWEKEATKTEADKYLETSTKHHLQDFINGITDSVNTPSISTGFKQLDEVLDGGLYEGLYFVGAISSLGKTTLVTQIADQIAKNGTDVLIFSLEMARNEIIAKSISRNTAIEVLETGGNTRDAKTVRGITVSANYEHYSQTEKNIIQTAITNYEAYAQHIYIQEGIGDLGVQQVRETVEKHVKFTGNKPVVVIDYIQILAPANERATDKQNTDKAVMELKRISRDFKIPVIGISSFNRDNYSNRVSMQSFKESGAIEYSSDILIGLQLTGVADGSIDATEAKKQDPRNVELIILKNRNGRVGDTIYYDFYPKFNYFEETEKKEHVSSNEPFTLDISKPKKSTRKRNQGKAKTKKEKKVIEKDGKKITDYGDFVAIDMGDGIELNVSKEKYEKEEGSLWD